MTKQQKSLIIASQNDNQELNQLITGYNFNLLKMEGVLS